MENKNLKIRSLGEWIALTINKNDMIFN